MTKTASPSNRFSKSNPAGYVPKRTRKTGRDLPVSTLDVSPVLARSQLTSWLYIAGTPDPRAVVAQLDERAMMRAYATVRDAFVGVMLAAQLG